MSGLSPNHTQEDVDQVMSNVSRVAFRGGVIGLALGAGVGLVLNRYSPVFRNLSIPGKTFLWSSCGVAGVYIAGDRFMLDKSRERVEAAKIHTPVEPLTASGFLRRYRYEIIGASWLASMAGALAYSFSERNLKLSQKLVHARMYAQFATVAVLLATAVATQVGDQPEQLHHAVEYDPRFLHQLEQPPQPHATTALANFTPKK